MYDIKFKIKSSEANLDFLYFDSDGFLKYKGDLPSDYYSGTAWSQKLGSLVDNDIVVVTFADMFGNTTE
jgi:hypothetical protein